MEKSTIELTAYTVIIPVYEEPILDAAESAVLQCLKEGKTRTHISNMFGFNIEYIISELTEKQLLNPDATLKYKDKQDWVMFSKKEYKKCYIFYDTKKEMFFDQLIYPYEIRFSEDFSLVNQLINAYIPKDILNRLYVINSFKVNYNLEQNKKFLPKRKISEIMA